MKGSQEGGQAELAENLHASLFDEDLSNDITCGQIYSISMGSPLYLESAVEERGLLRSWKE